MQEAENISIYRRRREQLAQAMRSGVAVIATAPERVRNRDSHFPYRFDSHFYYLTGFAEPEAVLVLSSGKSILFCRERNPEREVWDGFRYGPERAKERFGFDEAHPIDELDDALAQLLENQPALFYPVGDDAQWDARAMGWLNAVRAKVRAGVSAPDRVQDVRTLIDDQRLIKDTHEQNLMRRAARIAAGAHRRAMQSTRPGRSEYEVEAELLYEFRRNGAQFPAYSPIVAGGANACVLHYVANDAPLRDGDLLLIDAGCELDGYASDITRTFPVSGRFTREQREIYVVVLRALEAATAAVRPGRHMHEIDAVARRIIEKAGYGDAFMHGIGHQLGIDVHDATPDGPLKAGMIITIEPGIYLPDCKIGIRLEDDILVTPRGPRNLTAMIPRRPEQVEAMMRAAARRAATTPRRPPARSRAAAGGSRKR